MADLQNVHNAIAFIQRENDLIGVWSCFEE